MPNTCLGVAISLLINAKQVKLFFISYKLGEQGVAGAKADLEAAEGKEIKLLKELKKLNKKVNHTPSPPPEQTQQLHEIKGKLEQATKDKEFAKVEADERVKEQEAIKMIRFKVGMNKMNIGYLDAAEKVNHSKFHGIIGLGLKIFSYVYKRKIL